MEPPAEFSTKIDYGHELLAVKHYLAQRIEGMLRAVSAPILRQDHVYEIRAVRGELGGLPLTARTIKDQEFGREITNLLGKRSITYNLVNSDNGSKTGYDCLRAKSTFTAYSGIESAVSTVASSYNQSSSISNYRVDGGTPSDYS